MLRVVRCVAYSLHFVFGADLQLARLMLICDLYICTFVQLPGSSGLLGRV